MDTPKKDAIEKEADKPATPATDQRPDGELSDQDLSKVSGGRADIFAKIGEIKGELR